MHETREEANDREQICDRVISSKRLIQIMQDQISTIAQLEERLESANGQLQAIANAHRIVTKIVLR